MPINSPSERGDIIVGKDDLTASPWFAEWLKSVFAGLFGWKRSYTAVKTFDFPNVAAGNQQTTTVACVGARQGDAVAVTAKTQVAGLGVFGYVSANDVVTIVRFNYTAAGIDPASDDFRVIVWQQ